MNALARPLHALFLAPVIATALTAIIACDVWLAISDRTGPAMRSVLEQPALGLALLALVVLSLVFHELGHAAACRYGGARPGRIGIGVYLVSGPSSTPT